MRGEAMSVTAAVRGSIVLLLSVSVVSSQNEWRVTYSSTQICAVKGSTVDISCNITFSSRQSELDEAVDTFWFRNMNEKVPVDLKSDSEYKGRVEYHFHENKQTLRIINVKDSDSAEYKFVFMTKQPEKSVIGSPGVNLSVSGPDLHVKVMDSAIINGLTRARLSCLSRCHLPDGLSYIWYRNGQTVQIVTSSFSGNFYPADSYSCALRGHEAFPSPAVCVEGVNCVRVTYADRSICAFEGSSVNISCSYNSYRAITSKFWFSPERRNQWRFLSQPEDLRGDSQYAGRVEVFETEMGRSTLRISDLKQSDSAQYHFKFRTSSVQWHNDLPATNLTVTALEVQVTHADDSGTAVLKCLSSCSPAPHQSFIWYKNGEKTETETSSTSSTFTDLSPGDSFACALKGYEDFPSPLVCVKGHKCNGVKYESRSICLLKGLTVDILCTYSSYEHPVESNFWFRPDQSHQWQNHTQPVDLREDSQYAGRVWVFTNFLDRSTLRISGLRESDSGQYHFTFRTKNFEWRSSLPGTTLTVTALQVQVIKVTVHPYYIDAKLKCHSICGLHGSSSYVWFKNGYQIQSLGNSNYQALLNPGDSVSCALRGLENYGSSSIYALRAPSISSMPSGEITEGKSVTLTCSSEANIAAKYTWYKGNQTLPSEEPWLVFMSIQSSDSAEYYCAAENELGKRTSEGILIDVEYAPRLPLVSVSPSAEVEEFTSVILTCSSDANPTANYSWYKENEDSLKASGQIFTIPEFRAEHSGSYYCVAQNRRGRRNSTFIRTTLAGSWTSIVVGTITALILIAVLLFVFIFIRKRASKDLSEHGERSEDIKEQCLPTQQEEEKGVLYTTVKFSKNQTDALYSNIRPAKRHRNIEEEDVEYASISFNNGSTASR